MVFLLCIGTKLSLFFITRSIRVLLPLPLMGVISAMLLGEAFNRCLSRPRFSCFIWRGGEGEDDGDLLERPPELQKRAISCRMALLK